MEGNLEDIQEKSRGGLVALILRGVAVNCEGGPGLETRGLSLKSYSKATLSYFSDYKIH